MRTKKFSKQLTIAIPQEHFEKIKKLTDDQQTSLAEFCRSALANALSNVQREEDQMND